MCTGFWWHGGITGSPLATITCLGHKQSLGPRKSSELLLVSWFAKLFYFSNTTPVTIPAVVCFLRVRLYSWNLAAPIPFAVLLLQMQRWFWLVIF